MKYVVTFFVAAALISAAVFGAYKLGFRSGYVTGAASEMSKAFFQMGFAYGQQVEKT